MMNRVKGFFGVGQSNDLIERGREIAGHIMLQGIFDLLRDWTAMNLTNFWTQLRQFFEVYAVPYVYEEKQKRWDSLDFGKNEVSMIVSSAKTRYCLHALKTIVFCVSR